MSLGRNEEDWSAWYRLFSLRRFVYEAASRVVCGLTLAHVTEDEVYVVAGDATQTPRSSRKMEGRAGCATCAHRRSCWAFMRRSAGSTGRG